MKKRVRKPATNPSILPSMKKSPLKMRRHSLSRRPPRSKRTPKFRQKADEQSESHLERRLLSAIQFFIPEHEVVQQYKFHGQVAWRFDFCFPEKQLAIEVQGYGPGHNSEKGIQRDYRKNNQALLLGFRILYFAAADLDEYQIDDTISIIRTMLGLSNGNKAIRPRTAQANNLRGRLLTEPDF